MVELGGNKYLKQGTVVRNGHYQHHSLEFYHISGHCYCFGFGRYGRGVERGVERGIRANWNRFIG
mgnify:CR=1 FL=1